MSIRQICRVWGLSEFDTDYKKVKRIEDARSQFKLAAKSRLLSLVDSRTQLQARLPTEMKGSALQINAANTEISKRGVSLSMLILLTTIACLFFSLWQNNPWIAYGFLGLITPALWRLIWVVNKNQSQGLQIGLARHFVVLIQASLTIGGSLIAALGLVSFLIAAILAVTLLLFKMLFGEDGEAVGFLLGIMIGIPLGLAVFVYALVSLLKMAWSEKTATDSGR